MAETAAITIDWQDPKNNGGFCGTPIKVEVEGEEEAVDKPKGKTDKADNGS